MASAAAPAEDEEMKKAVTKDLPEVSPEEFGAWVYHISKEMGRPVEAVFTDVRRLAEEMEPEVKRLQSEGYPLWLAKKAAAGGHPNSRDLAREWLETDEARQMLAELKWWRSEQGRRMAAFLKQWEASSQG